MGTKTQTSGTAVLEHIGKSFPTPSGDLVVLKDVSLTIASGASAAIMGPSGCGKSTLLNILGTLEAPTSGTVRIGDKDPFALSVEELATFRNGTIGFVFQDHHLLPQCSVLENVLVPALASPDGVTADVTERAKSLLERVGLSERLTHRPAELSGGERQRTSVVRSLINKPRLLLCDEPTGNLDGASADSLGDLFVELSKDENVALVVVTHSPELADRFDVTYRLKDGALESDA